MNQRGGVSEARRIELKLRIPRPPARIPGPRRPAVSHDVPDAEELTGMIVEDEERGSQRRARERDPVAQEKDGGEDDGPDHVLASYWQLTSRALEC